jgi:hypothetical protein
MRYLLLFLVAFAALGANVKLYLKDGSHHVVREYKIEGDRVRFYSVERSDWEEIPLELIDLTRTEGEAREKLEAQQKEAALISAEDKAEREMREEIERVPADAGVYLVEGEKLTPIRFAESKWVSNKRRSILKVLTPIPIVAGKATIELDGEQSQNLVPSDTPEFYIRLSALERFGIFELERKKGARIVNKVSVIPVTQEIVDDMKPVEIFRRQVDEGLYKIWPMKPLPPGEYAVVQYTEGKGNLQVWDFAYRR